MSNRVEAPIKMLVNGTVVTLTLIENPIIDDVVVTEAKLQAAYIGNNANLTDHRVDLQVRDFLIRLGVER
jgi:hypothetical protein